MGFDTAFLPSESCSWEMTQGTGSFSVALELRMKLIVNQCLNLERWFNMRELLYLNRLIITLPIIFYRTEFYQTLKCCFSKEYYIFVLTYTLFWHTLQRTFAADSKSKSKELWQRQVFST